MLHLHHIDVHMKAPITGGSKIFDLETQSTIQGDLVLKMSSFYAFGHLMQNIMEKLDHIRNYLHKY